MFLFNLFNPNLGHKRVPELRASQGLSDVNCFVATMVRVGCNWTLNMKLLCSRNIVIVVKRDANNKKTPPNVFDIKAV